jgi:hypothetical protein
MNERPRLTPSRRRAVGAAAWTAPLVIVGSAAPAYAASATARLVQEVFVVAGADYDGSQPAALEVQLQVHNVSGAGGPSLAGVVQTLEVSSDIVDGGLTVLSGSAWSHTATTWSQAGWLYTFVYALSLAPTSHSSLLTVRLPLIPGAAGIVRAWATATHPDATPVVTLAGTTL